MNNEHPKEQLISVPAAYFWNSTLEIMKFEVAVAKTKRLMSKAQLELLRTIISLSPEISKQLAESPTFIELTEATTLGARTADLLVDYDALSDELAFCRIVDNYLLYVSELLALIFKTKPEALKSDEKVSIEMILGHATLEDLIEGLTERRVLSLSLKSIFALNNYLTRRLSFRLVENDVELQTLVEIVESRNLYVHNRGVVNRHYLNKLPNSSRKIGESLNAREELGRGLDALPQSVFLTDARAAAKFHIPRTEPYTPIRSPILGF